ncbi:hypothetical protein [Dactylosporangium sp. NPDC005555]|uniref:hypothetical protein n=1 Tax=Dactylosporangium sp. NPDC005555 TaxID=3154889 RepID=UPI00339E688E
MADLNLFAERVIATRGRTIIADLAQGHFEELVFELDEALELGAEDRIDIRFALGAACTTVARTIEHLTAALQLPYRATRSWSDFVGDAGDRSASLNQWLVVYDAADLLRYEDEDRWHELAAALGSESRSMGGGSSTLVLLDEPGRWERSRFSSAQAAQATADQGRR